MIILGGKGSVAIVIFNTDSQKFILVQQFRPAVYISNASKVLGKVHPQLKNSQNFEVKMLNQTLGLSVRSYPIFLILTSNLA